MAGVFVSYRRSDAGALAGRLADRLIALPQVSNVFLDVESIGVGENFAKKIDHVLASSDYCLILIGPGWTEGDRLFDAEDFVRREAVMAINGPIKVIPVLVGGAKMPSTNDLPGDLRGLPAINAFPVRTEFFNPDTELLFDKIFGEDREKPGAAVLPRVAKGFFRMIVGAAIAAILLLLLALISRFIFKLALNEWIGKENEAMVIILAGLIFGGSMLGLFRPWRR